MFWKDNNSIEIVMADDKAFTVEHLLDEGETSTLNETPKTLLDKTKWSKIEELNDD